MAQKRLSVVIVTKNNIREHNSSLAFVIKALLCQDLNDLEIIIVDDSSTDETTQFIRSMGHPVQAIPGKSDGNNLGSLRNQGAAKAQGELLLFMDDDTFLPTESTISQTIRLLSRNDFACGAQRFWTHLYWARYVDASLSYSMISNTLQNLSVSPQGINRQTGFRDLNEFSFIANFGLIKRKTFFEVGGFNEEFEGLGMDDTELMMRLCMSGYEYRILFDNINVIHLNHVQFASQSFMTNLEKFYQLENKAGYHFHVNHFFGVYEGDGHSVLTKI